MESPALKSFTGKHVQVYPYASHTSLVSTPGVLRTHPAPIGDLPPGDEATIAYKDCLSLGGGPRLPQ